MSEARDIAMIDDFCRKRSEQNCVEFKKNFQEPKKIGEYISALSNSARLYDQRYAYVVWGVEDETGEIIGTKFDPAVVVSPGEPLDFWLTKRLQNGPSFQFRTINHPLGRLVLLEIPAATRNPVEFDRMAYIRIGSATPRLADYPERQHDLWTKLQPFIWEEGVAKQFLPPEEIIKLIDYPSYFDLVKMPLPTDLAGILDRLSNAKIIRQDHGGKFDITNLGAILFAKRLDSFDLPISRKAVRVTVYEGLNRASTVVHSRDEVKGYANGFNEIIDYIKTVLPKNEHIGQAFRAETPLYPEISLRELVANALIHQDMTLKGVCPSVDIFSNRIEITNPGVPLIAPDRFIDSAPGSRNEALADLMRRSGLCEERGSGIDKVIKAVELYQLPPPEFRQETHAMRVILFAPRSFNDMTSSERLRACYQHAVLKFLSGEMMRNESLRERLGVSKENSPQISNVISSALKADLIKSADEQRPRSGYLPHWA